MQKAYLIGYDLRQPGRDYKSLFQAIESYGTYWRFLDSTWVVRSSRSAAQIRDHLIQYIDNNDKLFVARLSGEAAWYGFSVDGNSWLKQQLEAA